jgi:membrane protein YdbS with pleckstrin-like domain
MGKAPSIDDGLSLSRMEMGRSDRESSIPSRNSFWLLRIILKAALIVSLTFLLYVTSLVSVMTDESGNWSTFAVGANLALLILMLLEVVAWLYTFKVFMYEFGTSIDLSF